MMTDDSIQQMYILHRISKCHSRKEKRKYDEYDEGAGDEVWRVKSFFKSERRVQKMVVGGFLRHKIPEL